MNETLSPCAQDSIYESLPALERYLDEVRSRRERRRATRQERERLETAIGFVLPERQAALEDEDADITFELDAVIAEFRRRLDLLAAPAPYAQAVVSARIVETPNAETSGAETPAARPPEPSNVKLSDSIEAPALKKEFAAPPVPVAEPPAVAAQIALREEPEAKPAAPEVEIAAKIFAPEPSPRTAQETQAILTGLQDQLAALESRWRDFDAQRLTPNEDINRPACLRARALACEINRLCAEAKAEELHDALHPAAQNARDKIAMARHYASDAEFCLPFQKFCFSDEGPQLTANDWRDLSALYERAALGQEAWNWYAAQQAELPTNAGYDLLNAIGAAQQMLFRMLDEFGAGDRLQAELYGKLRESSDRVGFLDSMHPATDWAILEARADRLPDLLRDARQFLVTAAEKREKDQRRQEAIQAVVDWSQERSRNDLSEDAVCSDRDALLPRLDECIAAGVPPSNPQVRGAILDAAPRLLDGLPIYARILEAVLTERRRKGLDALPPPADAPPAEEEDDLADAQVEAYRELVRTFAEGLKIVIVGGGARPLVAEKLKQILHCKEAEWIDSKKGDRMSRFKTQICRADIVIAVKNFASHEMTEKSRDWAKECGIGYVLLPGGYGVNQIIHQMSLQLLNGDSSVKAPPPAAKSSGIKLTMSVDNRAFTPSRDAANHPKSRI